MICSLCGPTEFPVTMRRFDYVGQVAYLTTCSTCAAKANVALAKAESRTKLRSALDADVRPPEVPFSVKRPGLKGRAGARFRQHLRLVKPRT